MPNRDAIQAWVDDLRSGRFQQTNYTLRDKTGYCCLGVACETYRRMTDDTREWIIEDGDEIGEGRVFCFLGESEVLPERVARWLGFDTSDPPTSKGNCSEMNDLYGQAFPAIADVLEAEYLQ